VWIGLPFHELCGHKGITIFVLAMIFAFFLCFSSCASAFELLRGLKPNGATRALKKSKPTPNPPFTNPLTPLSIPEDDLDPTSRASRLKERADNWKTRHYDEYDDYINMTGTIDLTISV
jgi:hypothetical protein